MQKLVKEEMNLHRVKSTKLLWQKEFNKVIAYSHHMLDLNEIHDKKVESCKNRGDPIGDKYQAYTI